MIRDINEPFEGNYFVSTYPPFSTWTSERVADAVLVIEGSGGPCPSDMGESTIDVRRVTQSPGGDDHLVPHLQRRWATRPSTPPESSNTPIGLYVHVPFCLKRCDYCYFLSYEDKSPGQVDEYLDAVGDELALYQRTAVLADRPLSFVYFGGGTPSLLSERSLGRLIDRLQSLVPWSHVQEVTFECAPKTVTPGKLRLLRACGVTRLSLGVQSLDDQVLQQNGRIHLSADALQAYAAIRNIGFPIVNVDLIVGLAGETERSFFGSLERIIAMAPESITIYQLEVPLNTPLYSSLCGGTDDAALASWETKRRRLSEAFDRLESAGYHVNSAYAAVRDPDRHRFVYQQAQYHGADLLGLGLASFSYMDGVHFQNVASEESYLRRIGRGNYPIARAYLLSCEERLIREFVLQLKLGTVDTAALSRKFGVDVRKHFAGPLDELTGAGWIQEDDHHIALTRSGLVRVDRLLSMFYRECHQKVRYS